MPTQLDAQTLLQLTQETIGSLALCSSLTDELGGNVFHLDSLVAHSLVLTLKNTTSTPITIRSLSGSPTESNSNFHIDFINNSFFFDTQPTVTSPSGWQAATDQRNDNGDVEYADKIFLSTQSDVTVEPGESHKISIRTSYTNANAGSLGAVTMDAQVVLARNIFCGQTPISGHSPAIPLLLLEDEGVPNPLTEEIVGPNRVLNNGTATQDFRLRFTNPAPEPISLGGLGSPVMIRLRLPLSNQVSDDWALCTGSEAESIGVTPPADWTVHSNEIENDVKIITLTPELSSYQQIPGTTVFDFVLTGVKSSLDPGRVNLYVDLMRFPIYGTQTRVVQIEKSPLIFKEQNVGVGADNPRARLDVQGVIQTYNKDAPEAYWDNIRLWSDGVNGFIQSNGDESGLRVKSNRGERILLESKVGVGTLTPDAELAINGGLHVGGDSDPGDNNVEVDGRLGIRTTPNSDTVDLALGDNDTGLKQQGDGELAILTNSAERVRVNASGNVGIGTMYPDAKLAVHGGLHVGGESNPGDNNVEVDGRLGIRTTPNSDTVDLALGDNDTGLKQQGDGELAILTNSGERVRVNASGNVGIGTTAPRVRLDVRGDVGNATQEGTSPHDAGNRGSTRFGRFPQGQFVGMEAETAAGTECGNMGFIKFNTWGCDVANSREVARLDQYGNLGIGTSSPEAGLHLGSGKSLQIGSTSIGENELQVLKNLAEGSLQIFLKNNEYNSYLYGSNTYRHDGDRGYAFIWLPGGPVLNGVWTVEMA